MANNTSHAIDISQLMPPKAEGALKQPTAPPTFSIGDSANNSIMNSPSTSPPPMYSQAVQGTMTSMMPQTSIPRPKIIPTPGIGSMPTEGTSTLDEPIRDTIMRELRIILIKVQQVLMPKNSARNNEIMQQWDLWGPLFLCVLLAILLEGSTSPSNPSANLDQPEFAEVFSIVTCGALVVTLNSKLLGASISFFQTVCILGYCLLPHVSALIAIRILAILFNLHSTGAFLLRSLLVCASLVWSVWSSLSFLSGSVRSERRALVVYPVVLFYFVISWLVLSHV